MKLTDYFEDWLKIIDVPELAKVVIKMNLLYSVTPIVPAYADIFRAFILCSEHDCNYGIPIQWCTDL